MTIIPAAEPKLDGKTALITGASAGMGLATAQLFAEHGANVVLVGRSQARLQAAADEIGDQALPVVADVSSSDEMGAAFTAAVERYGGLDIVFNNAGDGNAPLTNMDDVSEEYFDYCVAVHLKGVWLGDEVRHSAAETGGRRRDHFYVVDWRARRDCGYAAVLSLQGGARVHDEDGRGRVVATQYPSQLHHRRRRRHAIRPGQ